MNAHTVSINTSLQEIGRILTDRGLKICVVETAAGGLISSRLVSVNGASAWFDGGVVAYSNRSKVEHTGISEEAIVQMGAVSADTTRLMAMWARDRSKVDVCLAESSLSYKRPGARSTKPAGLSFIAIAHSFREVRCNEYLFHGDRLDIMEQIADRAVVDLLVSLRSVEA